MINEALNKEENRKKFRELVMKYHPDKKSGDKEIMARINASRVSDEVFEKLYKELSGIAVAKKESKIKISEYEKVFDGLNAFLEKEGKEPVDFIVFGDGRVKISHGHSHFYLFDIGNMSKEDLARKAYNRIREELYSHKS